MARKLNFNGIEISQTQYDNTTVSIFDYLDKIKALLEKALSNEDENAQFSVDVDFSSNRSPKHKIKANGSTKSKTRQKIAKILKKTVDNDYSHLAGSVRVNFLIEDRQ